MKKKKWIINEIALQNKEIIKNGKLIRRIGIAGIVASVTCIVIGEVMNDSPLNIFAMNNEAADLIDDLSCIYADQTKNNF